MKAEEGARPASAIRSRCRRRPATASTRCGARCCKLVARERDATSRSRRRPPPISTRSTRSSALSFPAPWPRADVRRRARRASGRGSTSRAIGGRDRRRSATTGSSTTEVHMLAIATHPDHRGRGIARAAARSRARRRRVATGCTLATLEVRRSNVARDRAVRARRVQDRARPRALLPGRRRGRARHAARHWRRRVSTCRRPGRSIAGGGRVA